MQRLMKLRTAIAFERSQNVAGQTLAVQTDDGNALIALAYYERDMFLRLLLAAEFNDVRRLAGRHRKPRSRRYGETRGIVIGLYVDSIDLHFRLDIAFKEKKGRQDASQPRQLSAAAAASGMARGLARKGPLSGERRSCTGSATAMAKERSIQGARSTNTPRSGSAAAS